MHQKRVCRVQESCLQLAAAAETRVLQNNALEIYSSYFPAEVSAQVSGVGWSDLTESFARLTTNVKVATVLG